MYGLSVRLSISGSGRRWLVPGWLPACLRSYRRWLFAGSSVRFIGEPTQAKPPRRLLLLLR